MIFIAFVALAAFVFASLAMGEPWETSSYPDEAGFQDRKRLILDPLAEEPLERYEKGYFDLESGSGDPAKYAVPNMIAKLLRNPDDPQPWEYLARGKHAQETYHFAAMGMARLFLLYPHLIPAAERERYLRELTKTVSLIGDPDDLHLGGGGTENHMTQWRFSALAFSYLFPDLSIGKRSPSEAREICLRHLRRYVKNMYTIGNGEWMSSTYIQFGLDALVNVYDAATDPEVKVLAKAGLDWMVAAYANHWIDGSLAGPEWRGWSGCSGNTITDVGFWQWFGGKRADSIWAQGRYTVPMITSQYRPNRVIYNIAAKRVQLPYLTRSGWPDYFMRHANRAQETLWMDANLALGSAQANVTGRDPGGNQISVWKLTCRTESGNVTFGGGHPYWDGPEGKSPWDQVVQSRGALLNYTLIPQDKISDKGGTECRFYAPISIDKPVIRETWSFFRAGESYVAVRPFTSTFQWREPDTNPNNIWRDYRVMWIPGMNTGFVIDTATTDHFPSFEAFQEAILTQTEFDGSERMREETVRYTSLMGDRIVMRFDPDELRPRGSINDIPLEWESDWPVFEGPYLNQKSGSGILEVSDGQDGFVVDFSGDWPAYRTLN